MLRIVPTKAARGTTRRTLPLIAALALVATPASAQPETGRELLNSERIEQAFGSYGLDVLENGEAVRVSNLFSGADAERVTRTFAVVLFSDPHPDFAAEHALIVAGGSIGAVFTEHGWTVRKRHRFFGLLDATDRVRRLMGGIERGSLATHVYVLDVVRPGAAHEYATIVETHHPDYLALDDLRAIYGDRYEPPVTTAGLEALLETLELARERMR